MKTTYNDCLSSPSMYLHHSTNAQHKSTFCQGVATSSQLQHEHSGSGSSKVLKLCTYEEQLRWHSECVAGSRVQVEIVL